MPQVPRKVSHCRAYSSSAGHCDQPTYLRRTAKTCQYMRAVLSRWLFTQLMITGTQSKNREGALSEWLSQIWGHQKSLTYLMIWIRCPPQSWNLNTLSPVGGYLGTFIRCVFARESVIGSKFWELKTYATLSLLSVFCLQLKTGALSWGNPQISLGHGNRRGFVSGLRVGRMMEKWEIRLGGTKGESAEGDCWVGHFGTGRKADTGESPRILWGGLQLSLLAIVAK